MTNLKGYFVPKQHWALMGKFAWWLVSSVYCIQMCLLITGCRRQFYKIFHWSNKLELRLLCPGSPHRQLREDIPAGRSKLESKWTMKKKKKVTWCGLGQSRAGKIFPNCEIFSILLSFSPLRGRCFNTLSFSRNSSHSQSQSPQVIWRPSDKWSQASSRHFFIKCFFLVKPVGHLRRQSWKSRWPRIVLLKRTPPISTPYNRYLKVEHWRSRLEKVSEIEMTSVRYVETRDAIKTRLRCLTVRPSSGSDIFHTLPIRREIRRETTGLNTLNTSILVKFTN